MSITSGSRQEQSNDPDDEIETYTQRCTAAPNLAGTEEPTQIGISTLDRGTDDSWVTGSQGGFIKLESKTLGFVPTRMTTAERDAIGTQAEEGMVIYNTETECLELYTGTEWICTRNKCKS